MSDPVMDAQRRFPNVHWIWAGGISFVYEVHPRIVVKVPKSGEYEREQFHRETKIYEIFSQHSPCCSVVQCFFHTDNGIFLEYMRDGSLSSRIQNNQAKDQQTMIVTKVEKLEPLFLRKKWMNDLAQAVAFLESLGLAHGDLRPENVLLDRDRLKLSDFDCTAKLGEDFEACVAPYGRLLNSSEMNYGRPGTSGFLSSRTELFALGSLYYLINYGFEVYGDRSLTEDPKEHGPKLVELLQNKEYPTLDSNPMIDDIISKCWHNNYATVAELAAHTDIVLHQGTYRENSNEGTVSSTTGWGVAMIVSRIIHGLWRSLAKWRWLVRRENNDNLINSIKTDGDSCEVLNQDSKTATCKDLVRCGLLDLLSSGEPGQLGFQVEWYRHSYQV
ncbi:kinase-like protein [Aspergillus ibericus CBS 121593]|uniref:Kinase-like protein n=1 Tax=Aspergillus ibericus CBS 121593 TaxID=1448316 RepID=A0A395HEJ7_9EURO|nr:kinase-like protein [Aspergillus ibericus CBS 121593]RAL06391.1 kinase-like protein [Aspergillus ibericus CBS 121593]